VLAALVFDHCPGHPGAVSLSFPMGALATVLPWIQRFEARVTARRGNLPGTSGSVAAIRPNCLVSGPYFPEPMQVLVFVPIDSGSSSIGVGTGGLFRTLPPPGKCSPRRSCGTQPMNGLDRCPVETGECSFS
jgi:hypothetical protein